MPIKVIGPSWMSALDTKTCAVYKNIYICTTGNPNAVVPDWLQNRQVLRNMNSKWCILKPTLDIIRCYYEIQSATEKRAITKTTID